MCIDALVVYGVGVCTGVQVLGRGTGVAQVCRCCTGVQVLCTCAGVVQVCRRS